MVRKSGLILLFWLLACCPKEPSKVIRVVWADKGHAKYILIVDNDEVGLLDAKSDLIYIANKDTIDVIVKRVDSTGTSKGKMARWIR